MFKNNSGRYLTKALFYELCLPNSRKHAIFTLKDRDLEVGSKTYKSLRDLYMQCSDPTEYQFAITHLAGWDHWKELQSTPDLEPHIQKWREEFQIRELALRLQKVIEQAETSFPAAKYLVEKGWEPKKAGRPSQQQIKQELKDITKKSNVVQADFERLSK